MFCEHKIDVKNNVNIKFGAFKLAVIVTLLETAVTLYYVNTPSLPNRLHILPAPPSSPLPFLACFILKENLHVSKFTGFLDHAIRDNMGNFSPKELIYQCATLLCLVTLHYRYFNLH